MHLGFPQLKWHDFLWLDIWPDLWPWCISHIKKTENCFGNREEESGVSCTEIKRLTTEYDCNAAHVWHYGQCHTLKRKRVSFSMITSLENIGNCVGRESWVGVNEGGPQWGPMGYHPQYYCQHLQTHSRRCHLPGK